MISANVTPFVSPDRTAMREHLEHLFGGFLDGYHDGKIEIAWTDATPDASGKHKLRHAEYFGTDELDEAADRAAQLNSTPMVNVYVGAALRNPDSAPFGRSSDADAWALTALYVDLDDPGTATAAKDTYGITRPTFVCVTGREPHTRAQLWWRLDEPLTDPDQWRAVLDGMAATLGGDTTVTNAGRVMRLAGSVAWPVKEGRVVELTTYIRPQGAAQSYPAETVQRALCRQGTQLAPKAANSVLTHSTTTTGLFGHTINDGRERYMRQTIAAVLLEYIGTTGTDPTPQELFDAAWPQYERGVDLSRPGRGPAEFAEKCEYAIKRFHAGKIAGMRDLDEAVATYKARADRDKAKWEQREQHQRQEQAKAQEERAAQGGSLILTAPEFLSRFKPPSYLIDGMIQRGYLYSLTARTGHGKTAVSMYLGQAIARGQRILMRNVKQGAVLFLAGENPDDIRARFMVLADAAGFKADEVPFYFIDGVIDIEASFDRIKAEADKIENLQLVIVDTAAAYFKGDDANSNTQQGAFARVLRSLTQLDARPCVLVPCHPVKNAKRDNLVPLGGGAFLNEVDGNLTLYSDGEGTTELHWQGKFRGPEFEPIEFKMERHESPLVHDENGAPMPSIVASPITETEREMRAQASETDENVMLAVIANNPPLSVAAIASKCNWANNKAKVYRTARRLMEDGLLKQVRKKYRATAAGKREVGIKPGRNDDDDDDEFP